MKWLKSGLLVMLVLVLGMACAMAQEQQVTVYYENAGGGKIPLEALMEDGVVVLHETEHGSVRLQFQATSQAIYQVKLLGIAANGQDFVKNEVISNGSAYVFWDVADTPGTYGPFRMQIIGVDYAQEYDVIFVVEQKMYEGTSSELAINGNQYSSGTTDFVLQTAGMLQTDGGISIIYPEAKHPLSGAPGYELGIQINRGETLPAPLYVEMSDAETGAVLVQQELEIGEWYADKAEIYCYVTIPEFESGRQYTFKITGGELFGSQTYTLLNEMADTGHVNPEDVSILVGDPDDWKVEAVPIETFMQDDGVIHLETNMEGKLSLGTRVYGNANRVVRLNWLRSFPDGNELNNADYLLMYDTDYVSTTTFTAARKSGVYPVTLRVQNGDMVREYQLSVTVPEGTSSRYAGMLDASMSDVHSFANRWDLEEQKQLETVEGEMAAAFGNRMGGNGAVYVGAPGDTLHVEGDIANMTGYLLAGLFDYERESYIASGSCWYDGMYEGTPGNDYASGSFRIEKFVSGKTYGLAFVHESGELLDLQDIVLINRDELFADVATAPLDAALCNADTLIPLVDQALQGMSTVQLGNYEGFWQHRYAQPALDGVLAGSFAVYDPVVPQVSATYETLDLESSANWTVYDQYQLQFRDGFRYPDMQPVNLTALNEQFAEGWQDLTAFEFAQGYARGADGAAYYLLPLYYLSAEGSILNDQVYLYVLIVREGMDRELIDAQEDYTWIDTGEKLCTTERILITDQAAVASILKALRAQAKDWPLPDVSTYEDLTEGMEGRSVRSMQAALSQLGYLTTSVDGVYGETTTEAVKAYQKDKKFKRTGDADADTLEALYADCDTRGLLRSWLDAQ